MAPRTVVISAPDPTAGHYGPMPPLETPGHSQASLAQSLVGSLLLSPGPCAYKVCCVLQESVAIIVLQFVGCLLGGSMVVLNGDLLQ